MSDCRKVRKNMVAYLSRELGPGDARRVEDHCRGCAACRAERARLAEIFSAADAVRENLRTTLASVDWEALPGRIADRALGGEPKAARETRVARLARWLARPALKPAYVGLAVGIVFGSLSMYVALRRPSPAGRTAGDRGFYASGEFLDRVEQEMARREALDYLEKSQYLLLDFVQAKGSAGEEGSFAAEQVRSLLAKKVFLNPQLDKTRMAKAKAICDQIEWLFLELSQVGQDLPAAEVEKLRRFVEDRQLLLKINIVKKELQESEV